MKVLFQGDSITDAGRSDHEDLSSAGSGYPQLIKEYFENDHSDIEVYNGGINGHKVVDLYDRWEKDCLNLAPDVLTILIGVNDVWHEIDFHNGVDAEKFETVYRMLLVDTLKKLPNIRIILMGAYLLHGSGTDGCACGFGEFYKEVAIRREITKKLAVEFNLEYIDLQAEFDLAIKNIAPESHWISDGVHPSAAGQEFIKQIWLKKFKLKSLKKG